MNEKNPIVPSICNICERNISIGECGSCTLTRNQLDYSLSLDIEIIRLQKIINKINNIIFAKGAPLGTPEYFKIRQLARQTVYIENGNIEMDLTEVYSVTLIGQGDIFAFLVDKETFDWINCGKETGRNNQSSWIDHDIPDSIKERLKTTHNEDEITITCGSRDNDRAIYAINLSLVLNDVHTPILDSVKELFEFVHDNDLTIVNEYNGHLY
jgi:hypothetical protein